jgi:hypothetical protein
MQKQPPAVEEGAVTFTCLHQVIAAVWHQLDPMAIHPFRNRPEVLFPPSMGRRGGGSPARYWVAAPGLDPFEGTKTQLLAWANANLTTGRPIGSVIDGSPEATVACWLGTSRAAGFKSISHLEVLLWIASGADSHRDLMDRVTLFAPFTASSVSRIVQELAGATRFNGSEWVPSRYAGLIERRPHPHINQGDHLSLTEQGRTMISALVSSSHV